ncbi:phage-related tail protein [Brevibacillus agri BAB-2500]|nr:phage-related tail protein [Brevibacillus agri BAB-2500]
MAERYRFFDSTAEDERFYTADEFAEYFRTFLSDGIFSGGTNLQVLASGTDMTVKVQPGYAWLRGYMYAVQDEPVTLSHDLPDPALDRIDRIVLRLDTSLEKRSIRAMVLKGEPGAEPVAPTIVRQDNVFDLGIATVRLIAGKSYIEDYQITDTRLDATVCGLVNSLITADTTNLFVQFQSQWLNWFHNNTNQFHSDFDAWFANIQQQYNPFDLDAYFEEHVRPLKKVVAYLNAAVDAESRVDDGYVFADPFNGEPIGIVFDDAKTKIIGAAQAGAQTVTVQDASAFAAKTEVTIYDDTSLERIAIESISGNEITFAGLLQNTYKEGANVARSMCTIDTINNKMKFGGWGQYNVHITEV